MLLYHQVISCVHPYKKERTLEEVLTEELEYYTLFLADDYKKEEHSRCSEIPLESFFEFPRISKLTTDIEVLRYIFFYICFLSNQGIVFSKKTKIRVSPSNCYHVMNLLPVNHKTDTN